MEPINHNRRSVLRFGAALAASAGSFAGLSASAFAQAWPNKPLNLVVPATAGGPLDLVARIVGDGLGQRLGQPAIVANRAGASGMIGAAFAAKAPADGYTLFVSSATEVAVNQWFYPNMQYNPASDFAPITLLTRLPLALVASTASGFRSVSDLVRKAKASPESVKFANGGPGGLQHLAAEMFCTQANVKANHVPYKGIAPAVNDLLAGIVDVAFVGLPAAMPHIQSGKIVALGVSTASASPSAPDIKPIGQSAEAKGYELAQWFGLLAPAQTPVDVLARLNRETNALLSDNAIRAKLSSSGAEPAGGSAQEFAKFIETERAKFGDIIKRANITVQS